MSHNKTSICPGCGQSCSRVALVNLVYTFESGDDNTLVETSWHKDCFLGQVTKERDRLAEQVHAARDLAEAAEPVIDYLLVAEFFCPYCGGEAMEDGHDHKPGCIYDNLETAWKLFQNKMIPHP